MLLKLEANGGFTNANGVYQTKIACKMVNMYLKKNRNLNPSVMTGVFMLLLFIPYWVSYAVLVYTSNRNRPGYEIEVFGALEYAFVSMGLAFAFGLIGYIRVFHIKFKPSSFLAVATVELINLSIFLVLWIGVTEFVSMYLFYGFDAKEMGLIPLLGFVIENTGRVYSGVFLYFSFMGMIYAYNYYRRQMSALKKAREADRLAAELKLKSIMNYTQPHFFFNCISSISELVHIDAKKADDALHNLSGILRYLIDTKKQLHSIADEMNLTHRYIELQRLRFGEKIKYSEDIDTDLIGFEIPILSIQLLIENSIQHAKSGIKSDSIKANEETHVHLQIMKDERIVTITVCDNGAINSFKPAKGSGMSMLVERIEAVYEESSFKHGFMDKTVMGKPGYQSEIHIYT